LAFVDNQELLDELIKSGKQDKLTNHAATLLMTIVNGHANKENWRNYSFNEDMRGAALVKIVMNWKKFDTTKAYPHKYFDMLIRNCFIDYLNKEKKHYWSTIKEAFGQN